MSDTTANQEATDEKQDADKAPTPNDVAKKATSDTAKEAGSSSEEVEEKTTDESEDADSLEEEADDDDVQSSDDQWRAKVHKVNAENKRLRQRVKAAEQGQSDAQTALDQYKAAVEVGLPLAIADRLKGSNLDEMIADAKALVEMSERGYPGGLSPRDGVVRRGDDVNDAPGEDLGAIGERIYRK